MESEFILTVKSTCFFKNHNFYVESVAPVFKMEVQGQVPINMDKMVLLFFRLRTSKSYLKVLSRNCKKTDDMVKYIYIFFFGL